MRQAKGKRIHKPNPQLLISRDRINQKFYFDITNTNFFGQSHELLNPKTFSQALGTHLLVHEQLIRFSDQSSKARTTLIQYRLSKHELIHLTKSE